LEELENPFMSINGDLIRKGGGEKAAAGRRATTTTQPEGYKGFAGL
jgi:hypothetical protein